MGDHTSIEGDVKFSDYLPKDGSVEMLSIGWFVCTGERVDVNPKVIGVEEVQIGNIDELIRSAPPLCYRPLYAILYCY